MTQIPAQDSQLDKIEHKVDLVLDRLTRMEERQNSHAGKLDAHESRLDEHGQRIREVELAHAVTAATGSQNTTALRGRWAALGATSLVILGAIGAFIGNGLLKLLHIGS